MYFCFSCSVCSAIAALVPSATATIKIGICFLMSMLKLIEMEFAWTRCGWCSGARVKRRSSIRRLTQPPLQPWI